MIQCYDKLSKIKINTATSLKQIIIVLNCSLINIKYSDLNIILKIIYVHLYLLGVRSTILFYKLIDIDEDDDSAEV